MIMPVCMGLLTGMTGRCTRPCPGITGAGTADPEAKAAAVKEIESMLNQDIDFPVEKIKIHIPDNAPALTVEEMMFALEFLEVID